VGAAPKSIRGLHVAVHSGFERAVRRRLLARNPADGVELPAAPRRRRLAIDVADLQALLAGAAAEAERRKATRLGCSSAQWATLWTFLAYTGLRIGEALALRWADVDLDGGWFTTSESLGRGADGGQAIGGTKTAAGDRLVPLTPSALAALRAHRDRQDRLRRALREGYADRGHVFAAATGGPLGPRNALRAFKAAVLRVGLPDDTTLHDLRRPTASLLVASGVDVATAAAILGHKNASVLLDVYARALQAPKRDAARRLERLLSRREPADG
jgi:integrase